MKKNQVIIPAERIERSIFLIRGMKVIIDADLAKLYGVKTKVLNQAVKRNIERFPKTFMFQLTRGEAQEWQSLRSQNVTLKRGQHIKYLPHAFTEYGALMAANILKSKKAISVSIQIIETFVRLRRLLKSHADLELKLAAMERKYDKQFRVVFEAIRQLMEPPEPPRKQIGFQVKEKRKKYGRGVRKSRNFS